MNSLPLHPAVVHVPLGLAMVMPLIAAGFAWAIWTGRVRPRAWLAVVALQALLVGSGFVSMRLGQTEEDRVETVVEKAMIHEHEENAEQFVYAAGATLLLSVLAVALRKPSLTRPLVALGVVNHHRGRRARGARGPGRRGTGLRARRGVGVHVATEVIGRRHGHAPS